MGKEAFKEVKPGLLEPEDSEEIVEIDEDFAEQVYTELKSGTKETDRKTKSVISQVQKASKRFTQK